MIQEQIKKAINKLISFIIKDTKPKSVKDLVKKLGGSIEDNALPYHTIRIYSGTSFTFEIKGLEDLKTKDIAHLLGHLFLDMGYIVEKKSEGTFQDSIFETSGLSAMDPKADYFAETLIKKIKEQKWIVQKRMKPQKKWLKTGKKFRRR